MINQSSTQRVTIEFIEYVNIDAVNTPGIDGATEDSKEEGQDGGNIPTGN